MSHSPILSICIPAYNRPLWFHRALESIVIGNKEFESSVEIVITDDSSTQECEEIMRQVCCQWSGQCIYEHHPVRLGMVENWNRAISLTTGQYIVVLHDDDFLLKDAITNILATIKAVNHPVLLFGVEVVDEQERVMKRQIFKENQWLSPRDALISLLSNSSFVRFPAIVVARSAFAEMGMFRTEWREPCDLDMWIRLFSRYGVYCLQDVTTAYRVHDQALTMGVFNEQTINLLLGLFAEVKQLNILSSEEIVSCKALFLYQFILAGAWRQLKRGRLQEFRRVMELMDISEVKNLPCPKKWWMLNSIFRVLSNGLRI
ncbi:glycosyltransferase family 2 protein [Pseudanabaena sp. Chao 1811]|uniref:glycosyltransferase family 2 protein n=1 Tax=Pseudanabaena sp. Chao 1811 TaxID=2963092 RepID=UPI0022F3A49F|nr:glycosyltransferase family 2 protein [Pseudanabaena sp. Chao 1811]